MAPRRTYRSVKVISNSVYNNLSLSDVLCPICRSILVEPVTLPCSHGFCFSCFEGTMANASLTCPLCRVRFSSWHRVAKKENKIINNTLWQAIKHYFPQQLQNKLSGNEDNLVEETPPRRLATSGEIRREYEAQKLKDDLELKQQRDAEIKASEQLIKKIRQQEEYEATVREEKLLFDEHVARQLAKEINLKTDVNSLSKTINTAKKRRPLDKFLHNIKNTSLNAAVAPMASVETPKSSLKKTSLTKILCQDKKLTHCFINANVTRLGDVKHSTLSKVSAAAEVGDSNDSIENECRYFKPIDLKNIPPSKFVPIVKVPAKMHSASTVIIGAPTGQINFNHNYLLSAFARFEVFSPILGTPNVQKSIIVNPQTKRTPGKKRKFMDEARRESNTENQSDSADVTETPMREMKRLNHVKNLKSSQKHSIHSLSKRPGVRKSSRISSIEKTPEKNYTVRCNLENSPNTRSKQKILNQIYCSDFTSSSESAVSPPFYGFDLKRVANNEVTATINNNVMIEDSLLRKKLQEESDLELAKRLQKEFNNVRYSTRSSILQNDSRLCKKRRQVTLDEIIISRSKVK